MRGQNVKKIIKGRRVCKMVLMRGRGGILAISLHKAKMWAEPAALILRWEQTAVTSQVWNILHPTPKPQQQVQEFLV